jgi:hypothetical protein
VGSRMADDEDSARRAGEEQPVERKPRFRFQSVLRPKPNGFFPDLSDAVITAIWDDCGGELQISSVNGNNWKYPQYGVLEEIATELGLTKQKTRELAQEFGIADALFLQIVLVLAVEEGQKQRLHDYEILWQDDREPSRTAGGIKIVWEGVSYQESLDDYKLLHRSDLLSSELEQVVQEQVSRATAFPRKGSRAAGWQPVVKRLLEALKGYDQLLRSCVVTEIRNPPNNPGHLRERAVLSVLSPMWPRLTGKEPSDDKANLYQLFMYACKLACISNIASRQSFYNWINEESARRAKTRKSDPNGD